MAWHTILTVSFGQSLHQFVVLSTLRGQIELCESRDGRPGLPVPNSPYGLCGRKATLNLSFVY